MKFTTIFKTKKRGNQLFNIKGGAFLMFALLMFNLCKAQVPASWTVNPNSFSNTATVTCKINESCLDLLDANNVIAAFVNGQCRGVASTNVFVSTTGDVIATLTIYSNSSSGEFVTFQGYNATANTILVGVDSIAFVADAIVGEILNPFVVTENHTPTDINITNQSISEGLMIGDTIGGLTAIDDNVPNTFTFSLAAGVMDNDSYLITDTSLTVNTTLSFALNPIDTVIITVTDAGGCDYSEVFIITITDLVYPPEANMDVYIIVEDQDTLLNVLLNDTDLDDDLDTSSIQILTPQYAHH